MGGADSKNHESLWMNISVLTPPTPPSPPTPMDSNGKKGIKSKLFLLLTSTYYVDVSRNCNTSEISKSNGLQWAQIKNTNESIKC